LYNNPDQSMLEARRLLDLATAASYEKVIPRLIMYQGISYDLNGQYDSAIIMYDSALIMAERYGLKSEKGNIYNNFSHQGTWKPGMSLMPERFILGRW